MAAKPEIVDSLEETEPSFDKRLWMLPVAVVIINLLTGGMWRANGLIFVALMEVEQEGRFAASFPLAIVGLSSLTSGLLSGYLGSRTSFRSHTSLGVFLFVLGLVACYFTTNVYAVTVCMFVRGLGNAMLMVQLNQTVTVSFKKHRTTAIGISSLGMSFAGFFWPYVVEHLLREYGLKGTFLLSGGIALQTYIPIFLISCFLFGNNDSGIPPPPYLQKKKSKEAKGNPVEKIDNQTETKFNTSTSAGDASCYPKSVSQSFEENKTIQNETPETELNASNNNTQLTERNLETKVVIPVNNGQKRKPPKGALKRVLLTRGFYLLAFSGGLNFVVQNSFMDVIIDFMNDRGVKRDAAMVMITTYSCGGIAGRLCFGWVTDKNYLTSQIYNALVLAIGATSVLLATVVHVYYFQLVCYFVMGLCQAAFMTSNYSQHARYFRKEDILMSMSAGMFVMGFTQLSRSPIIGLFRDILMSYDYFFGFLCTVLYIMSVSWAVEHYLIKREEREPEKDIVECLNKT